MFSILFMVWNLLCGWHLQHISLGADHIPRLRAAAGRHVSAARMRSICAQSIGTLPLWSLHSSLEKESVSKKTRWTLISGGHAFCVTCLSLAKLEAP